MLAMNAMGSTVVGYESVGARHEMEISMSPVSWGPCWPCSAFRALSVEVPVTMQLDRLDLQNPTYFRA